MLEEISDEIEQRLSRTKKQLLGSNVHDHDALVNQLLDLSPVDVLQKLFQYCEQLFQGKTKTKVTNFVMMCNSDKPSRKLFQLALHKACHDLVKPVEGFRQEPKSTTDVVGEQLLSTKSDDHHVSEAICPTQGQ